MNPLQESLTRRGYLIWSLISWAILALGALVLEITNHGYVGSDWAAFRVIITLIFIGLLLLSIMRRLENADWSPWLALLVIIPPVGIVLWAALFFVPPQQGRKA